MNRFRTKKKAKDGTDVVGNPIGRSDSPSLPALKSSKTFRLGRKTVPEPERKLELDLANALPSSDDFRTSLLMSGLSARFSMLREQDDPKSKIGKASDDSVLFPKRQSRLNDLGYYSTGLHDIAEVSSIKASIRPPFASNRVDSFHSVDSSGDDGGSMMSRAKPGEGNNLFGGRQKIYKIAVGGSTTDSKKMGGRALYDDDVSQSSFQKLRDIQRQEREREQEERYDETDSAFPLRSNSPPLSGYNRNRETSSTTSSGPSLTRSSTAATSITSQRAPSVNGHSSPSTPAVPNQSNGLDRSATKGKRLYENGLDQHLHTQQHSAINRLDNLSRQQTLGVITPSPSPFSSNGHLYEHEELSSTPNQHNQLRSASPPPAGAALGSFDFGVKSGDQVETQKSQYTAPPLSPPMSDADDQPSLPIQPNDRGKATALGAFSKPVQPYDEKKYTQRQLQMQQGRETPPLRKHSPPRAFHPRQPPSGRPRAESNATYSSGRSRSSSAHREFMPQNRNVASQVARMEAPTSNNFAPHPGPLSHAQNGSAMNSPNGMTYESGKPRNYPTPPKYGGGRIPPTRGPFERPPESQHPANRQRNQRLWADYTGSPNGNDTSSVSVSNSPAIPETTEPITADSPEDSPTLGPGNGLSGMVRQHLRNDSNTSSVYGAPSPNLASGFPPPLPQSTSDSYSSKGNPWEFNDWDQDIDQPNGYPHSPPKMQTHSPVKGHQMHSTQLGNTGDSDRNDYSVHNTSWEAEMASHHTRNGSSETQKENVDFTNKLASARKRVQENLKSRAESESRSNSPVPAMEWEKDGTYSRSNPNGALKPKSSRESIIARSKTGQSKAMKMLGIGNSTINSAPPSGKQKYDENLWKQEEEEMLRGVPKSPRNTAPTKNFRQARRDAQRDRERQVLMRHQQQGGRSSGDSDERVPGPSNPPQFRQREPVREREPEKVFGPRAPSQESKSSVALTNRSGSRPASRAARDRSSSDASGRSKSRNGRHRDDIAKAMADGHSSSAQGLFENTLSSRAPARSPAFSNSPAMPSPAAFTGSPAMPSPAAFTGSPAMPSPAVFPGGRSRSNSRTAGTGYFDGHQLQPIQTGQLEIGTSPRPSPVAPFAVNPTPALSHPSPIPSVANTPTSQGFQSQGRIPSNLKRAVNKAEISHPMLVSKTSHITTVDLPPGASLQNGMASAPPLPAMDPRRRQTRTQTVFGGLIGKSSEPAPTPSLPSQGYNDEMSTFSADEADQKPKFRQKLRKSSSEGGNLNARARHAFTAMPSPAVPNFPQTKASDGNMF